MFTARYGLIPYIWQIAFSLWNVKMEKTRHFEASEQIYPTQCSHPRTAVAIAPVVQHSIFTKYRRSPLIFTFCVWFKDSGLLGYKAAPSVSKDSRNLETDYLPKQES